MKRNERFLTSVWRVIEPVTVGLEIMPRTVAEEAQARTNSGGRYKYESRQIS